MLMVWFFALFRPKQCLKDQISVWEKLEKMDIFVSLVQNGCLLARQVEKDEIRLKN